MGSHEPSMVNDVGANSLLRRASLGCPIRYTDSSSMAPKGLVPLFTYVRPLRSRHSNHIDNIVQRASIALVDTSSYNDHHPPSTFGPTQCSNQLHKYPFRQFAFIEARPLLRCELHSATFRHSDERSGVTRGGNKGTLPVPLGAPSRSHPLPCAKGKSAAHRASACSGTRIAPTAPTAHSLLSGGEPLAIDHHKPSDNALGPVQAEGHPSTITRRNASHYAVVRHGSRQSEGQDQDHVCTTETPLLSSKPIYISTWIGAPPGKQMNL